MNKKYLFRLLIVVVSGMATTSLWAKVGDVLRSFNSPGNFCTGLAFDGKQLWVSDRQSDLLIQIEPTSGAQLKALPAPGYSPTGLAWDGTHLWVVDDKELFLYRINVNTGEAEHIIEAYTRNPKDICWDGKLLWMVDDRLDLIMSIDPQDGMMISNFPSPARNADGLAFDGRFLWVSDRGADRLYRVCPSTGQVISAFTSPGEHPRGLAWDGQTLWNVDYQTDQIYQIKIDDPDILIRTDPKMQQLDNHFDFRNYGPGEVTALDVYLAIPENRDNQELLEPIIFDPQPLQIVTDQWGQKFAHFQTQNLPGGQFFRVTMTIKARIWNIEYFIDPDKVGDLKKIPEKIKKQYLVDGQKLMINDPFIQQLARKITGDETNPYFIARKIYNYLIENLSYNLKPVGGWNTAPTVLKRGTASCSEYSFSLIALCRAAGVPARYVGAVSLRGDDASLDEVFHRWTEVYLPNYGWIPFDANKGDRELPGEQATGIGDVDS
ncbi:MAG: transglutaminase domain-containing protein, partial [bacterium]|nr:transglutaminase domain-containing protein [bacterium]